MEHDRENLQSARRHFGVALIDLHYAANDLAAFVHSGAASEEAHGLLRELRREIARLRDICASVDAACEVTPDTPALARFWPDLVRRNAALQSRN